MSTEHRLRPNMTAASRALLPTAVEALKARAKILRAAAELRVGEAERVAFLIRKETERRKGQRTRNNLLFAHGSNAEVGGYLDLDDLAVCGLEANADHYSLWIALAALSKAGPDRAGLLRFIFSIPDRLAWCRAEGARVRWTFAKRAYDAELEAWRAKAAAKDKLAAWRKSPMTERQAYMIALICARGGIPDPGPVRRGRAHDWIHHHGGDPKFWEAPLPPPDWHL